MENKFNNNGNVNIDKQINNTNNSGQINISSDNSTINTTQNFSNKSLNGIDLKKLSEELNILEIKLAEKKMYEAAGAINNAIEEKEPNQKIGFLQKAGMKTLEISQQLSLPIATAALAKSLGVEI
jgi:hypothetical protein